jgi:hypothetical protein
MKFNNIFLGLSAVVVLVLTGCIKNQDITQPDFVYQTLYFGTQYPVRTVELGWDEFVNNSMDNQHKVMIQATLGGVRDNTKDRTVSFSVDSTLCNRLYFSSNGSKIIPMPASYFTLASNQLTIPAGSILGGVQVQLTDAFFADSLSMVNTYAIPLVMTDTKGGDSILRGLASVTNPNRVIDANWTIKPRDFVIYTVKYVNPWHANYLRRGTDVISGSVNQTLVRHPLYIESDEVNKLSTASMTKVNFPIVYKNATGTNVSCTLQLTFDATGNCTVSALTAGVSASGTGKFVSKGDKSSWGNQDRDALFLDYTVDLNSQNMHIATKDTLVMRDRAVSLETFSPVIK